MRLPRPHRFTLLSMRDAMLTGLQINRTERRFTLGSELRLKSWRWTGRSGAPRLWSPNTVSQLRTLRNNTSGTIYNE